MLEWIRKRLRDWLKEEEEPPPFLLVRLPEGIRQYHISGVQGLSLIGSPTEGRGAIRLITESDAVNREHFWSHFRRYESIDRFTWEDGAPFDPMG